MQRRKPWLYFRAKRGTKKGAFGALTKISKILTRGAEGALLRTYNARAREDQALWFGRCSSLSGRRITPPSSSALRGT